MENSSVRLWFVSDIHASNACFRKFLNFADNPSKPNVLIIGGDITGKHVVPIVERERGQYSVERTSGSTLVARSEVAEIKTELEDSGCYVYECDATQFSQFKLHKSTTQRVFDQLAKERLKEWVALADAKLAGREDCEVFINAGNDDPLYVDEILDSSKTMVRPEGKVIKLRGGMTLVSTGYSNKSPWDCPRDETEEALLERIMAMTGALLDADAKRTIFNFHCPPRDSLLDLAPALEVGTLRKVVGPKGPALAHVGSTSVRAVIKSFQPTVSLHGHIHTGTGVDRIGRTHCFNPGSDYSSGALQGVFLVFDPDGKLVFHQLTHEREPLPRDLGRQNWLERSLSTLISGYRYLVADQKERAKEKTPADAGKGEAK